MAKFYNENIHSENLLETNAWRTYREAYPDATHTMDASHAYFNVFDGTNEAILLPNATTLDLGHQYFLANDTTRVVEAHNYDNTNLVTLGPNNRGWFFLNDNTTSAGDWIYIVSSAAAQASYSIFGFYNGNANTGRILEFYPGEDSLTAPYIVVSSLAIVAVTLGATTAVSGTKSVGVFKTTDTVNPIYTIDLVDTDSAIETGLFIPISQGDELFVKVTAGSILKPYITLYFAGI